MRKKPVSCNERLTKHEGIGEKRCEGDQETAKSAPHISELWDFSSSSICGIVGGPVDIPRRSRIVEGMIGERVCVCPLSIVFFLRMLANEEDNRGNGYTCGKSLNVSLFFWSRCGCDSLLRFAIKSKS
jgi:hypothetical protein